MQQFEYDEEVASHSNGGVDLEDDGIGGYGKIERP